MTNLLTLSIGDRVRWVRLDPVHKDYGLGVDADGPYVECGQGRHEIKTSYNRKFFELADGPW